MLQDDLVNSVQNNRLSLRSLYTRQTGIPSGCFFITQSLRRQRPLVQFYVLLPACEVSRVMLLQEGNSPFYSRMPSDTEILNFEIVSWQYLAKYRRAESGR